MSLVSIVVPVYNVEKFLPRCIDSLIKQTYKNIEIILVDDGSTDASLDICKSYQKDDTRIKVINKVNGGLSDARNYGIEDAKGDYIVFVDSDDYVSTYLIEKMYRLVSEDNSQIGICSRLDFFESDKEEKFSATYSNNEKHKVMDFYDAIKELCSFRLFDMSAWAKIYDKRLFDNIRFPVGRLSEDYFIMYLLFEKCHSISYINEPLYFYNQREGSISRNKKINYDYRDAARNQMLYIEKKYPELKKYVRTAYLLSNMTIFNWYISNRGIIPSRVEYIELKKEVQGNFKYLASNKQISATRRLQARIFIINRYMYVFLIKVYKYLKKTRSSTWRKCDECEY